MSRGLIEYLMCRARAEKDQGLYREALATRREAEKLFSELPDATMTEVCKNLNMMAFLAATCLDRSEAVRVARKCLDLYQTVDSPVPSTLATYTSMLAFVLAEAGDFSEAVRYGNDSVELFSSFLGPTNEYVRTQAEHVAAMSRCERREYLDKPSCRASTSEE